MNKATSLYLDAVRFLAALLVFISHACGQRISGGLFWQLGSYGPEAVTVFFVLSGFVIAHATATRETSPGSYAVARLSRIYSVALPALILTAAADATARAIDPGLYTEAYGYVASSQPWQYFLSALFLNRIWMLEASPGSNWSYWSLGYEVWYYAIFAALTFLAGRRRVIVVAALLGFVGPSIAAMFPLWLLGVACYRICAAARIGRVAGLALFLFSLGAWALCEIVALQPGGLLLTDPRWLAILQRPELVRDYIAGFAFAGTLVGFRAASLWIEPYTAGSWRFLRWIAGATFSLYLFHEPLLRLLATVSPFPPASWAGRGLVIGGTFALVLALAQVTERRKGAWRRALTAIMPWGAGASVAAARTP